MRKVSQNGLNIAGKFVYQMKILTFPHKNLRISISTTNSHLIFDFFKPSTMRPVEVRRFATLLTNGSQAHRQEKNVNPGHFSEVCAFYWTPCWYIFLFGQALGLTSNPRRKSQFCCIFKKNVYENHNTNDD